MKARIVTTLIFSLITFFNFSYASLPEVNQVPGGIAIINLKTQSTEAPIVFYNGHRAYVFKSGNKKEPWSALIGIPLGSDPSTHTLQVDTANSSFSQSFKVKPKKYQQQNIVLKRGKPGKKSPNEAEIAKRLKQEEQQVDAIFSDWQYQNTTLKKFIAPVNGRLSSTFGLERLYNNVLGGRHRGIDIAAPKGTPIVAPADGKVAATGRFLLTGNTVFIDHGQGLITVYAHMSTITVHSGEIVKAGTKIGTIGTTGRSTGPHLHWGVSLNDTRVDPTLFLKNGVKNNKV